VRPRPSHPFARGLAYGMAASIVLWILLAVAVWAVVELSR
jgi:hypothetical protein